ncbi:hypothetical protein DBR42_00445 [Pelomonas sp. HMWF004]|nr:hypothetical protein DBR42_00445 [Pelomonas sp. HMWF004]
MRIFPALPQALLQRQQHAALSLRAAAQALELCRGEFILAPGLLMRSGVVTNQQPAPAPDHLQPQSFEIAMKTCVRVHAMQDQPPHTRSASHAGRPR